MLSSTSTKWRGPWYKKVYFLKLYMVYVRTKGVLLPPISKQTPKNPIQIRVEILKKGATNLHWSSPVIRKPLLTNSLSKCDLYRSLFQLSLAGILFSILLLCLCIVKKASLYIWFYELCQFLYSSYNSIEKKRKDAKQLAGEFKET